LTFLRVLFDKTSTTNLTSGIDEGEIIQSLDNKNPNSTHGPKQDGKSENNSERSEMGNRKLKKGRRLNPTFSEQKYNAKIREKTQKFTYSVCQR
jgi:hypothetical protein